MAKPSRYSDPSAIRADIRTFFVTSKSIQGRALLQTERMANLFIDVLRSYVSAGKFKVDDFVVMPNHVHVLVTIGKGMTIEKATQLMKGNFSYRAKKELGFGGEVWQPGYSAVQIDDYESFLAHRAYIYENPVKAGLAKKPEDYPYSSAYFRKLKKSRG
jgi:putative transposase